MSRKRMERRKVLMVLPFLITPFLAFGFYALGGGKGTEEDLAALPKGINTALPDAQFKEKEPAGKMEIYNLTGTDSSRMGGLDAIAGKLGLDVREDPQTRQINEKIAAISQEINSPYVPPAREAVVPEIRVAADQGMSGDVAKLEALMKNLKADSGAVDPEMLQLNAMMDKLIAVQNPDLAGQIFKKPEVHAAAAADSLFAAIPAAVAVDQKARQGSVVELRLLDTVVLSGVVIPKGHALFGLASFSNQRLNLEIRNVRLGNRVIPVNLTVYDQRDAMQGINAPEALLSDAVNSGIVDASGSVGISGFDLTTQIAGAGIDAARSLLTKKIRRVKQGLKAGYPLLLRDNSKNSGDGVE